MSRVGVGLAAAAALVTARLLAAVLLPISDCDETYNYWEPLHYALHGTGKQTWEYAPQYALRSWLYIWLHSGPGRILQAAAPMLPKYAAFYATKVLLSACCAVAELYMVGGVHERFGGRAARCVLLVLVSGAGIAQAAPAFLPSSFAMLCYFIAAGAWLRLDALLGAHTDRTTALALPKVREAKRALSVGVMAVCAAAVVGWPFAALVALPVALHVVALCGVLRSVVAAVPALAFCVALVAAADTAGYCSLVVSPWNLIRYNVLGGEGRGPELYGVEAWHFFARNLTLNFNLGFWLALVGVPLVAVGSSARGAAAAFARTVASQPAEKPQPQRLSPAALLRFTAPFHLWFVFWLRVPHKEERFMAPAYPFLALGAGLVLSLCFPADGSARSALDRAAAVMQRFVAALAAASMVALGVSRAAGMSVFYGGPERLATALYTEIEAPHGAGGGAAARGPTVCVGKEWHRFPSQFFLPPGARYDFVTTDFEGALPKDFAPDGKEPGSCAPVETNDRNRPAEGQSIAATAIRDRCDYVVDSTLGAALVPPGTQGWRLVLERPLLDASRTPLLCRLGYLPTVSERCARWASAFVLKRAP